MKKDLKHLGVTACISVVPVMVATLANIPLIDVMLMNLVFFPIEYIIAAMICKYMGWDK